MLALIILIIVYMVVGLHWMLHCLWKSRSLGYETDFKLYAIGMPLNFIFWPISMFIAYRNFGRNAFTLKD